MIVPAISQPTRAAKPPPLETPVAYTRFGVPAGRLHRLGQQRAQPPDVVGAHGAVEAPEVLCGPGGRVEHGEAVAVGGARQARLLREPGPVAVRSVEGDHQRERRGGAPRDVEQGVAQHPIPAQRSAGLSCDPGGRRIALGGRRVAGRENRAGPEQEGEREPHGVAERQGQGGRSTSGSGRR